MKLYLILLYFIVFIISCQNGNDKYLNKRFVEKEPSAAFVNLYNQGIMLFVDNPFNKDSILKSLNIFNKAEKLDNNNYELLLNKIHIYISLDSLEKAKLYSKKIVLSDNENNYIGLIYLGNINRVNNIRDSSDFYYELAEKTIVKKIDSSSYKIYLNNLIIVKCLYKSKLDAKKYLQSLKLNKVLDTDSYNDYLKLVREFNENNYLNNYTSTLRGL